MSEDKRTNDERDCEECRYYSFDMNLCRIGYYYECQIARNRRCFDPASD